VIRAAVAAQGVCWLAPPARRRALEPEPLEVHLSEVQFRAAAAALGRAGEGAARSITPA
jgi:hypothetical protein